MKVYRLKKEAVQFFSQDLATRISDFDFWKKLRVDEKALEEVEPLMVTYGHEKSETHTSLSGWTPDDGQYYNFTIYFPSMKFNEADKFGKGRFTRELMDKIQTELNKFYQEFNKVEY